jgi:hypothetical protein
VSDDEAGTPGGTPARLTIGQRLLTALPNLQRAPEPPPPAAPTRSVGRSGGDDRGRRRDNDNSDAGEDEALTAEATGTDGGDEGATAAPAGTRRRGTGTAPSAGRKRPADIADSLSREEIVHMIKKVDDRERFMALFAAPLGVVVGIALTAIAIHVNPAARLHGKVNPKHVAESIILIEGAARILLSGIVVAAALSRRRSLIGFALLFLGTSMGSPLFALPFWALGGYLIWRVFKYQRALNARGRRSDRQGCHTESPGRRLRGDPRRAHRRRSALRGEGRCHRRTRPQHGAPARSQPARTGRTGAQQAVHTAQADQAPPARPVVLRPQAPGSTSSAERNRRRISWRRRTSERAVGSSPMARNTSTSVTMPTTVE